MGFLFFGVELVSWQIFAAAGLMLVVLEIFVPSLILLPIGMALLLTAPITLVLDSATGQLACFAVLAFAVLAFFQKYVRPKFLEKKNLSNVSSMVGKIVLVEETIDNSANTGAVKLYGDHWRAVTKLDLVISHGSKVKIIGIDGNKVIVENIL